MAIKTMDTSLFDKITGNENVEETKDEFLSEEDMKYLYLKGIEELDSVNDSLRILSSFIFDLFCGETLLSTEESVNFFAAMEMFIKDLIPAILAGDYEEAYKYCSEELTEEELEDARTEFYQLLYKKFLER